MTPIRRMTAMLLACLLALSFLTAAAQDDLEIDPFANLGQYEGIESAVGRIWSVDFEALAELAMEESDEGADPLAGVTSLYYLGALAIEFDSDDNAEGAFDELRAMESQLSPEAFGDPEAEVSLEDLEDVGDQAFAIAVDFSSDFFVGAALYSFALEDEYIFAVISSASDMESASMAFDVLDYLVEHADDHTGLGDFDELGESSDGLWEYFPDENHDLLTGLVVVQDEILYPEPEDDGL